MTSGELKFALAVETVLNWIPHPEYRQLIVETLMIFTLYAEQKISSGPNKVITIEDFVHKANELFLQDQVLINLFKNIIYLNSQIINKYFILFNQ